MKKIEGILLIILLAGVFSIFLTGCEKHVRHKVLTFFFTGVPPLEGDKSEEVEKEAGIKKPKGKKRIPSVFVHGPKAAGECFLCHDTDSTLSFKRMKRGVGMPKLGDITPGRLVAPLKELCIQCHTSKSSNGKLWVHGPLSGGVCTSCHDYHQSGFRYMLFKESSIDLCSQCHAKGYITQIEEHQSGEECISCHNPHIGANRLLLRKDFNEVF
jgi:predicted CXXCH cytochrome family protein